MSKKPSIIFVDDQGNILQSFRRSLRSLENVWDIHYASGGTEALRTISNVGVDVIVSDTNMPGMRGTELLREVQAQYPEVIRLVLSGGCRNDDVSLLLRTSHQFFTKPFNLDVLKNTIDRLLALRNDVNNDAIKKLVAGLSRLPCSPDVYKKFESELSGSAPDLDKLGTYISEDPGLSAKLLQALNSTFFGISKSSMHPYKAVQMMGPGTISYLFIEGGLFQPIEKAHKNYGFLELSYKRSLYCAHLVQEIAIAENIPDHESAYTSGLLSRIGEIILAHEMPADYAKLTPLFKAGNQNQVEKQSLGTNHAFVGAYFLGLWGFPSAIVDAIRYAPTPEASPDTALNLSTIVHVAQALSSSSDPAEQKSMLNLAHIEKLGLTGALPKWTELNEKVKAMDIWKTWNFS